MRLESTHIGHVAAQRHNVANTGAGIIIDNAIDLGFGSGDAGQMRGRFQIGFVDNAFDASMRAVACRAARAISHRHEIGGQWRKPSDGLPELLACRL